MPKPAVLLESSTRASTDASRTSPSGAQAGETELDTGTFTDNASMWSRKLTGQSVALKERKRIKSLKKSIMRIFKHLYGNVLLLLPLTFLLNISPHSICTIHLLELKSTCD